MTFRLVGDDAIEAMQAMAENSVDAIVTDPPYGLEFMGKEWDRLGEQSPGYTERPRMTDDHMGKGFKSLPNFYVAGPQAQRWHHAWATEALRILKPGGHLLAFGGTRTYHRLACAIEDAGFEIRDCIAWMYGSGFPKSLDVSKAIDKTGGDSLAFQRFARAYASAVEASPFTHSDIDRHLGIKASSCFWVREDHRGGLPPRHHWEQLREMLALPDGLLLLYDEAEREVVGSRKQRANGPSSGVPFNASVAELEPLTAPATPEAQRWNGWGTALKPAFEPIVLARKPLSERNVAANVQRWGTGALNIDGCRIEGEVPSTTHGVTNGEHIHQLQGRPLSEFTPNDGGRWPANVTLDETAAEMLDEQTGERPGSPKEWRRADRTEYGAVTVAPRTAGETFEGYGDTGGASRFFYCPKADREERNRGLGHMAQGERPLTISQWEGQTNGSGETMGPSKPQGNTHPTVKPVELMRWLCRMVTPKGGTVLDPFTGSGSTGVAAMREGFEFIGIEREAEYVEIARARIFGDQPLFNVEVGGPTE